MWKHCSRAQNERENEAQNMVAEQQQQQLVPEIRYEICHPQPLIAHRFNYDYRHRDRFGSNLCYVRNSKIITVFRFFTDDF